MNIEDFRNEKIAINCETELEAKMFMEILDRHDMGWWGSRTIETDNKWNEYGDKTCYEYDDDLCFGEIKHFEDCRIIKFKDFVRCNYE